MIDEALSENPVIYLYNASAKGLYNLALYSIGDQSLAEQLAIEAFVFAYNGLSDKSDVTQFRIISVRQLYLKSKKKSVSHSCWHSALEVYPHESIELAKDKGKIRIRLLLSKLNYEERFLLLLYFQQKFSYKQVAQILRIPKFLAKKRLCRMLDKTMNAGLKGTGTEISQ